MVSVKNWNSRKNFIAIRLVVGSTWKFSDMTIRRLVQPVEAPGRNFRSESLSHHCRDAGRAALKLTLWEISMHHDYSQAYCFKLLTQSRRLEIIDLVAARVTFCFDDLSDRPKIRNHGVSIRILLNTIVIIESKQKDGWTCGRTDCGTNPPSRSLVVSACMVFMVLTTSSSLLKRKKKC